MNHRFIDERFGVMLMEDEKLLLDARPTTGFRVYWVWVCVLTIVGIVALPLALPFIWLAFRRYRYWVTNKRVILCSGVIGYTIRSIPLERVSDVALSRTFPEMLAGIQSVIVRDMTGEAQSGKSLLAVENAPLVQKLILEEVRKVNAGRATV